MSKSIKRKLMAVVVAGVMALPIANFADAPMLISEKEALVISENEKEENEFITYKGEISEVINKQGNISILVNSVNEEDEYGMVFHIADTVSLWNRTTETMVKAEDLKESMDIQVFYHKNTPMMLSLPAQLTPDVIVIQDGETNGSTFMGEFDKALVSTDKYLELTIGEETVIVDGKGQALTAEDIAGNPALVFYGISTKSIPAQTTPSKVVVFVEKEEAEEEVKEMISLRDTATGLAYKVEWDNDAKTATLTKENQTIVITLDSPHYTLNKSLGRFTKAPELKEGVLYVEGSILEFMSEDQ